ncbi:MAG: BsuPI-related putative proteinase inhibitor [Candidatus Eremiobacteraeota bacterium]|nr:BsuPI-related putative proteinase inhibitor [Candidatus Eremiobacteraeota bacterium]
MITIFFRFRFRKKVERDPRKEIALFVILIVVILLAFMGALRYFVVKSSVLTTRVDRKVRNLSFSLKMEKEVYYAGDDVKLRLGVKNLSDKPVYLEFPTNLEADFLVQREQDLFFVKIPFDVWKYSAKVGQVNTPHTVKIEGGREKVFTGIWDQSDFEGKPVVPGKYRITGSIDTKNFKIKLFLRGETATK